MLLLAAMAFVAAGAGVVPGPGAIAALFGALGPHERYACEGCGCGCASAHECWTACCCHTPHERLAWAMRNGVLPPAYVRFTTDEWIAAANEVRPGSASCAACLVGIRAKLAAGVPLAPAEGADAHVRACCAKDAPSATAPTDATAARTPAPRGGAISALACKGLAHLLLAPAAPAAPAGDLVTTIVASGSAPPVASSPDRDRCWRSRTLAVDAPPPRVG